MTDPAIDPLPRLAHKCWAALETLHVVGYFAPETAAAYAEFGLKGGAGYFTSRSAPMGAVSPDVVIATFYVFSPALVRRAMAHSWRRVTPEQILAARHAGMAEALHRLLGDPDVEEAAALARTACAALEPQGRALYAGHAALPWPDEPLMALWHAASLLREHRGDGHVATLLLADLDPLESVISYGLNANMTTFMKATRGWTEEEWAAGEGRLRARGLLDSDGLTEAGMALRRQIEASTAAAAEVGWRALGAESAARLLELVTPLARTIGAGDLFPDEIKARQR